MTHVDFKATHLFRRQKKLVLWLLSTCVLFIFHTESPAQTSSKAENMPNTIWGGIGGVTATPISIIYEHAFKVRDENRKNTFGLLTGFGLYFDRRFAAPFMATYTTALNASHHLEIGIGTIAEYSTIISSLYTFELGGAFSIMYKYQKAHQGFCFKVGWTPTVFDRSDQRGSATVMEYFLMPGVYFGGSF
jgi:hypothetical protein